MCAALGRLCLCEISHVAGFGGPAEIGLVHNSLRERTQQFTRAYTTVYESVHNSLRERTQQFTRACKT